MLSRLLLVMVLLAGPAFAQEGDPPADSAPPAEAATSPASVEGEDATPVSTASTADDGTPAGALEAYIRAQEFADWSTTADYLADASQDDFDEASEEMDDEDLIETGLRFREEDYHLDSSDDSIAIFYSKKVSQYLVMTREDGRWRVDPRRTDAMNLEPN